MDIGFFSLVLKRHPVEFLAYNSGNHLCCEFVQYIPTYAIGYRMMEFGVSLWILYFLVIIFCVFMVCTHTILVNYGSVDELMTGLTLIQKRTASNSWKLPCKTEVLEPSVPVKFNSVFWYWYSFWKGYSAVEVGLEHETAWSCLLCKYQSDAFYSCNFFSMVHWCWKECYCRALCIFFLFKQGRKFCHNDVPCHKFTLEEKGPCNLFYWLS